MSIATARTITVRVLCFAQLKNHLGESEFSLVIPAASTGRDLRRILCERSPKAGQVLEVSRLAINGEYAPVDAALRDGDEVAIIPPVSGG